MKMIRKNRLALAITVGAMGLGASAAHAVDFSATAAVDNTLAVTVVQDMDWGNIFLDSAGAAAGEGVAALVMTPAGGISLAGTQSATAGVKAIHLGGGAPAQATVATSNDFTVTVPAGAAEPGDFEDDTGGTSGGGSLAALDPAGSGAVVPVVLTHSSGDPGIPDLWLINFTVGDETNTDTLTDNGDATHTFEPSFGATDVTFGIGATLITEVAGNGTYEAGDYSGTFEVTASF